MAVSMEAGRGADREDWMSEVTYYVALPFVLANDGLGRMLLRLTQSE